MTSAEIDFEKLRRQADAHPYSLVFATISGAHLYGFPSPDSDFDLRGTHVLPLQSVIGLDIVDETVEKSGVQEGIEMDLVTHDIKKFIGLMLKKNGYVLEQLLSPLVVQTSPEHEELKSLVPDCLTRHHAHHYLGFAETQWKLFQKESPPRVKPLLYVYRVLLTGLHLMRTGEVNANLLDLNREANMSFIDDLVARKLSGPEKGTLDSSDLTFHEQQFSRLIAELRVAYERSHLPNAATAKPALCDLLTRIRLKAI